jgi:hypothetical protein
VLRYSRWPDFSSSSTPGNPCQARNFALKRRQQSSALGITRLLPESASTYIPANHSRLDQEFVSFPQPVLAPPKPTAATMKTFLSFACLIVATLADFVPTFNDQCGETCQGVCRAHHRPSRSANPLQLCHKPGQGPPNVCYWDEHTSLPCGKYLDMNKFYANLDTEVDPEYVWQPEFRNGTEGEQTTV